MDSLSGTPDIELKGFKKHTVQFYKWIWIFWFFLFVPAAPNPYFEFVVIMTLFLPLICFSKLRKKIGFAPRFLAVLSGLFLLMLSTQFINAELAVALDSLRSFFFKTIIVFVGLIILVPDYLNWKKIVDVLSVSLAVAVFFGLWEYFFGSGTLPFERSSAWPEAVAPFGSHKNHFGVHLAAAQPVILAGIFYYFTEKSKDWFRLLGYTGVLLLSFPVLFWTLSRSGQGGALSGLAIAVGIFNWDIYLYVRQFVNGC